MILVFQSDSFDWFEGKNLPPYPTVESITRPSREMNNSEFSSYISSIQSLESQKTTHQSINEKHEAKETLEKTVTWDFSTNSKHKKVTNTLLSENVEIDLKKDVQIFFGNQDYSNDKGVHYERGYLLYGVRIWERPLQSKQKESVMQWMDLSTLKKSFEGLHSC